MVLSTLDWSFVVGFLLLSILIGIWASRSNKNSEDYFKAGGKMPWWLLGTSMVATTFSTDTPNLVTDIVRQHGVSGNWSWWAFLLTGMLTVFVYAKLWKKSGVLTDVEFYELRYSGQTARFLRGFRAIYLGIVFNVMIMAAVSLAAIKIGSVLMGLSPVQTILIAGTVTVIYSSIGGLRGVIITDFLQFFMSITGAIIAAFVALNHPQVNGLDNLLTHENVVDKLSFFPSISNTEAFIGVLLIPLLVQWWSVWYPGAEPGGGGYIAQRMFAAKNEDHSMKAVLFFNIAHYALRPWPWIIVALCSLVVFPDLESFKSAFPNAGDNVINHDLGYPAMLTFIPSGLLGLVVTSLIAAYMSTISTHLNWGASYFVNDFYKRFMKPEAEQKELLIIGKVMTAILMILTMTFALVLDSALSAFQILLQIGAGTGLIFILRWFWWRINANTELAAMIISFLVAIYFEIIHTKLGFAPIPYEIRLISGVSITTITWLIVAFATQPTSFETLVGFINKVNPGGPGWKSIMSKASSEGALVVQPEKWKVPTGILCMVFGTVGIYSFLMGTGLIIYGRTFPGILLFVVALIASIALSKFWKRII